MRHKLGISVILFYQARWVNSMLEDIWKRYFGCHQVGKKIYTMFVEIGH